jgi:hypothetical protein
MPFDAEEKGTMLSVERIVALTSTSTFGTVYVDSARNAVAHRSTWWQPRASIFVEVDKSPNVSNSSGTLSWISQRSRTPRPVLVPPWKISPFRSRAFTVASTPCQYDARA